MQTPRVTVAVPTLAADEALADCLRSLEEQTFKDIEVIVVDNSGSQRIQPSTPRVRVISNSANLGFGVAVNQAFHSSHAPYFATLNDDAIADRHWLEHLVAEADAYPRVGMLASQIRLAGTDRLDSAGMLIARDGSSKQRGHRQLPEIVSHRVDALLPSGCAAFYRRETLEDIGVFDESFFLYCEDTDLGLRARWAGWECRYVAAAEVDHRYSHSSGKASALKAYYVERNRLYTVVKNFPSAMLWIVPIAALARYWYHFLSMFSGSGKASEFRDAGHSPALLPWLVFRAHAATIWKLPRLLQERRKIHSKRRIRNSDFRALLESHSIGVREVAAL